MELSNQHRRFLLIDQGALPTLPNLLINVVITWLMNRSSSVIPVWGANSIAGDLLVSGFLLPLITCFIISPIIAGKVRTGKLPPLLPEQCPHSRWFRRPRWMRGVLLGTAGIIFGALPIIWALSLGQAQPFPLGSYVVFKAVWASMLALLVMPIISWWALANASMRKHSHKAQQRK